MILIIVINLQSIEGRRNPSVSKIHYTLYLGDCQKASAQALEDAIGLLASISTYINSQERIATSFDTWNETIRKDLEYLQTRLQDANTKVIELRSLVYLFIYLPLNRRSKTLLDQRSTRPPPIPNRQDTCNLSRYISSFFICVGKHLRLEQPVDDD